MALARADTARTMLSRKNSTSVLDRGLSHVFKDLMNQPLPDSLEKLQEFCMKHHETSFVSIQNIKWWSFMNHMVYGSMSTVFGCSPSGAGARCRTSRFGFNGVNCQGPQFFLTTFLGSGEVGIQMQFMFGTYPYQKQNEFVCKTCFELLALKGPTPTCGQATIQ